jgi:hypothetical protein
MQVVCHPPQADNTSPTSKHKPRPLHTHQGPPHVSSNACRFDGRTRTSTRRFTAHQTPPSKPHACTLQHSSVQYRSLARRHSPHLTSPTQPTTVLSSHLQTMQPREICPGTHSDPDLQAPQFPSATSVMPSRCEFESLHDTFDGYTRGLADSTYRLFSCISAWEARLHVLREWSRRCGDNPRSGAATAISDASEL